MTARVRRVTAPSEFHLRRREGNADAIIPSLFAIHGVRKKSAADTNDKPNPPAPVPVVNPPAPVQPGNNGVPVAKTNFGDNGPFMSGI